MKTLAKIHPELVLEWSDKNGELSPEKVSYGSNQIVWWIGKCGHEWKASIKNRSNGSGCSVCSGNQVLQGVNDEAEIGVPLAIFFPEERVAIEFSDKRQNHGPLRRWENAKNWLCVNAGIRMIRVISPDAIEYKNCECIRREGAGHLEGCHAIEKAIESI